MDQSRNKKRPSSEEVAGRLLVLQYIVKFAFMMPPRDMLEQSFKNWTKSEQADFKRIMDGMRDGIWKIFRNHGLWDYMTKKEREYTRVTALTISDQQHIDAVWRLEALQVLMWALGLIDKISHYDTQASQDLLHKIHTDDIKNINEFIKSAQLRPSSEIDKARDIAEGWHWRSNTRQLIEEGRDLNPDPKIKAAGFNTFDDIVRFSAKCHKEEDQLEVIDEDFAVLGKAYRDLTVAEWSTVNSITVERHFALNWLCGYAPKNNWDETPTDT